MRACAAAASRLAARRRPPRRTLHAAAPSCRNRILFEPHELQADADGGWRVQLGASDSRSVHISSVLRASPGQRLRVGVVNGARACAALSQADAGWELRWRAEDAEPPLPLPNVDVLLAMPRPKVARRLWAPLAALGVGALFVTPAARVERSYFSSHVADAASVRAELLRGLEQAGDTRLPPVFLARRFPQAVDAAAGRRGWSDAATWGEWLIGDAAALPPPAHVLLLAHPGAGASVSAALREAGVASADGAPAQPQPPPRRVLVAVGPEGGWTPHELAVLHGTTGVRGADAEAAAGARCVLVSLGARPLTTDTACVALLAAVKEATCSW